MAISINKNGNDAATEIVFTESNPPVIKSIMANKANIIPHKIFL